MQTSAQINCISLKWRLDVKNQHLLSLGRAQFLLFRTQVRPQKHFIYKNEKIFNH